MKPPEPSLGPPPSPLLHTHTPPSSPPLLPNSRGITVDDLKQAWVEIVQAANKSDSGNETKAEAADNAQADEPKRAASKVEYKMVDEVWDNKTYKYKTIEPSVPTDEVSDLDEYVFVVRARIGEQSSILSVFNAKEDALDRNTGDPAFFIDVKSKGLADVLRTVLRDVRGISLEEDAPTIERNLLYHYLSDLEAHQAKLREGGDQDTTDLKHLDLLLGFMQSTYASTKDRLAPLLKDRKITYDLLWALFKPKSAIFTTFLDTAKPSCFKYDYGEETTTSNGTVYFRLECRFLDYDGHVFGEVSTALAIRKFRGAKRIETLEVFPLAYHEDRTSMRTQLLRCGRRFATLMGVYHVQYCGNAFYVQNGEVIEVHVNSRIMVDAARFREVNPNYARPRIDGLAKQDTSSDGWLILGSDKQSDEVKSNGLDPEEMQEDDLLICSPTVFGWSFGNKQWFEFAVDDISDIVWNPSSFTHLAISPKKKKVILALAEAHTGRTSRNTFDDFIEGKGQGLIILLHGPPGVGKTLTAEGLAEYLRRPLYSISAGELGNDPQPLEDRLSQIFCLAHHWKAFILLDEADVFVQARALCAIQNPLVSVFLRKLEYNRGIMFLTTNRVRDFDDAVQSRITLGLRYETLAFDTRRTVWDSLLKRASNASGPAKYDGKDLVQLAKREVNGRQIKNIVSGAHALAVHEGVQLTVSHLEEIVALDEEFENDYKGARANKDSYL